MQCVWLRRSPRVALLTLLLGTAGGQVPDAASCPECAFGRWHCPSLQCNASTSLRQLDLNFQYNLDGCIEETPISTNVYQVDIDMTCYLPSMGVPLPFDCASMRRWSHTGVGMLAGCNADGAASAALAEETCVWVCKQDTQVVARCRWSFDHGGSFAEVGGAMKHCWLEQQCESNTVHVGIACEPTTLWTQALHQAADLTLAAQLLTHRLELQEAWTEFKRVEADPSSGNLAAAKDAFEAAEATLKGTLQSVEALLAAPQDGQDLTGSGAVARQQVSQQLAALIKDLNATMLLLDGTGDMYKLTQNQLQLAEAGRDSLEEQLRQASERYKATQMAHEDGRLSLIDYQQQLEQEKDAHNEQRSISMWLAVTVGVLLASVASLLGVVYVLIKIHRIRLNTALTQHQEPIPSAGGTMVVGRPVPFTAETHDDPNGRLPKNSPGAGSARSSWQDSSGETMQATV